MLSKPRAGWSDFTLGDFKACASYLTDIPFDWLRSCINGLKYFIPASFFLDEEGSTCLIISDWDITYIIRGHSDPVLTRINNVSLREFSGMLIADIKENFEDWIWWCDVRLNDEQYARRTAMLRELIDEAEKCLDNYMKSSITNY